MGEFLMRPSDRGKPKDEPKDEPKETEKESNVLPVVSVEHLVEEGYVTKEHARAVRLLDLRNFDDPPPSNSGT